MRAQLPVGSLGSGGSKASTGFGRFANLVAHGAGHPFAFLTATAIVVIWAVSGPVFSYSDTWQLVVNTGTTIITFLMVFLIQHTQNRDTRALQLKLDELILATKDANNGVVSIEEETDEELIAAKQEVRAKARKDTELTLINVSER